MACSMICYTLYSNVMFQSPSWRVLLVCRVETYLSSPRLFNLLASNPFKEDPSALSSKARSGLEISHFKSLSVGPGLALNGTSMVLPTSTFKTSPVEAKELKIRIFKVNLLKQWPNQIFSSTNFNFLIKLFIVCSNCFGLMLKCSLDNDWHFAWSGR